MGDFSGSIPTFGAGEELPAGDLQTLADVASALTGVWTDWSSSFTITGSSSNPTKGNSTYTAKYVRLGKLVIFKFKVVIGSSFSAGSGTYGFAVPIAANTDQLSVGSVWVNDSGTAILGGVCTFDSNVFGANAFLQNNTGGALGSGGPGTAWATNDRVMGSLIYETA